MAAASSIILRQGRKSISITNLFRSFSTSDPLNPFENSFSSKSYTNSSSAPLPNRRLRDEKTSPQPPKPKLPQSRNGPGAADFLERFKLGFENGAKDEKIVEAAVEEEPAVPADADEIFKKLKETGLIPNAVAMLDGLCKDGLVQEAMKLFGLMREKGTIPEVVIYTAVVEGFCKAHKFDDAIRVFQKMKNNSIGPNAFSYGVLVRGFCKGNRLEDALEFCVEMLESGHSPNFATFIGLVGGFCREKGLEDAKSLIATLKQKGFFYDEKAAREYLDKKGPSLPLVWEAVIGKKASHQSSFFD